MADPEHIYNWLRLDERLTTSGQPTETELGAIADLGVHTVVNLGLHSHPKALRDEAASVAALGMRYIHRPVEFGAPTEEDFQAFCETMEAMPDGAVHVHCIANWRVSAFVYRHRVERLGWDRAKARADLEAVWTPDAVWSAFIGDV
jgi:protein tyrosine phosphatase (PTP) superfamily phosphohydrolase (DUF442 family)